VFIITAGAASKILALENVWNQAEEKGDARALDLIFDDAMIYVDEDGSVLTKTQFLAHAKGSAGQMQSLTTLTLSVHVYGDTAVVAGSYRVKGMEKGKPYQRDGRFIDTWTLKQGNWRCVAAQATPVLHE
jgi:ketosteroid isomerase-like protein